MNNVVAVILGGGRGTRLDPLTRHRSKPAVPFGGKYRLVDIPISNCIHSGYRKIFVVTQYNSESLNRSISQTYKFDIFSKGYIRILAAEQSIESNEWLQGTADAIRKNIKHITSDREVEYVLVLSGDQLYKMDYRKIIKRHIESGVNVTLSLTAITKEKAPELGLAKIDENGDITAFVEKPEDHAVIRDFFMPDSIKSSEGLPMETDYILANMGLYVFSKKFLCELMETGQENDFGKDIIPGLLGKKRLAGFIHHGYWEDIGTIKSFYEANLDLTSSSPKFDIYDRTNHVYAQPMFLPPSKISSCIIKDSLISDGCILKKSSIKNSVVGVRTVINEESRIDDSILMGADYYDTETNSQTKMGIGKKCVIKRAIIDKNVSIGDHVKIINKDNCENLTGEGYVIRDGIILIEKGAIIPNGTTI